MSLTGYLTDNTMPANPPVTTTDQFLRNIDSTTDANHHLNATLAYCATEGTETLPATTTLFNNSPIAGWLLHAVVHYEKLTGSPLTTHTLVADTTKRCAALATSTGADPAETALNHYGLAQLHANYVTDPATALAQASAYLEITESHHWYAQDLPIAAVVLHYAIDVGTGPIASQAIDLMKAWEQRLTTAVTKIDPDFAYTENHLLNIWQEQYSS